MGRRMKEQDRRCIEAAENFRKWKEGYDRARAEGLAVVKNESGPRHSAEGQITRQEKAGDTSGFR